MPGPFFQTVLTASLPNTVLITGLPAQCLLLALYMRPVNAALASALTVSVNWDDGQPRSHPEVVLLTSLALFKGVPFMVVMAANTDLSISAVLTGLGSCDVSLYALVL